MASSPEYHGSIVAFEGPRDVVSTQLRLLPTSPKILVLPPLQYFLKEDDEEDAPFDARTYILRIHEACNARIEMARMFLQDSSPDNKRLVFMNGGTASAQTSCITAISQYVDDGDISKAKGSFNELARNGVAGLRKPANLSAGLCSHGSGVSKNNTLDKDIGYADRVSEAMRAADALDLETSSLQPSSDIDLTIANRKRSISVPPHGLADDLEETAPFYVFGTGHKNDEAKSVSAAAKKRLSDINEIAPPDNLMPENAGPETSGAGDVLKDNLVNHSAASDSPNCSEETNETVSPRPVSVFGDFVTRSSKFGSLFRTPVSTYVEARFLDICAPSEQNAVQQPRRIKSVDRVYAGEIRNNDISVSSISQYLASLSSDEHSSQSGTIHPHAVDKLPLRPKGVMDSSKSRLLQTRHTYVDKGTSPDQEHGHWGRCKGACPLGCKIDATEARSTANFQDDKDERFETVLPMYEDLVIHFSDERLDTLLESVIQGFRGGAYPVSMPPLMEETESEYDDSHGSAPCTERHSSDSKPETHRPESNSTPAYSAVDDDWDPFASHNYLKSQTLWTPDQDKSHGRLDAMNGPPTPARTPSPVTTVSDKSFHKFKTTDCATAVCVQNSLRSILNIYFSPDEPGYQQFTFPLLPELSSVWKPVFRETTGGSPRKEKRKIDLILAIGAQKGVAKEFLSALTGSLERLGARPRGITRSGRLDMRYLIANAMQSYTSQPLASQTRDNPFTNSLLLATLIIPHLETYLAAHSETRFLLLEYPPEHLSTVLSLQRLVGVDILKVAGILGSESTEPKSATKLTMPPSKATPVHSSPLSRSTTISRTSPTLIPPKSAARYTEVPSFSKANFLLTSSAIDSEIATLICTIWKILIDVSHFYIPEGVPKPTMTRRGIKTTSKDLSSNSLPAAPIASEYPPLTSAKVMMGFQAPSAILSTHEQPPADAKSKPREKHQVLHSSASIKSSRTARSSKSTRLMLQKLIAQETGSDVDRLSLRPPTINSYCDFSEDEESRFYQDERRYIPLFAKRPEMRKGNSRKALKFLGLA